MEATFIDLLLKQNVVLYNNIAKSGDCTGRLYAEFRIYPSPHIVWEFESLGDTACEPETVENKLKGPLVGIRFVIDEPYVSRPNLGTHVGQMRGVSLGGSASQARFGDLDVGANSFLFCLPNAQFQEKILFGQGHLEKTVRARTKSESRNVSEGTEGRFIQVPLDDTWSVYLETRQEGLDWLDPRRNVGTLITTIGRLYHFRDNGDESRSMAETPTMTMREAEDRLSLVSLLLSFANGGYLGPLYIEGVQHDGSSLNSPLLFSVERTTPLELLGISWAILHSDLKAYLYCYPTFKRMLSAMPWDEAFKLILMWYFQAIQPEDAQVQGKSWPAVANALGAALERLSYTILVLEERDSKKRAENEDLFSFKKSKVRKSEERIRRLLDRLGISMNGPRSYVGPKLGLQDDVSIFIELRNEATHPKPGGLSISNDGIDYILNVATQWVEETLLWRLGYNGKYRDRSKSYYASIEPRYDLSTRDPNW